jgi:spermidine/putrescine transport system substrate-binding protein
MSPSRRRHGSGSRWVLLVAPFVLAAALVLAACGGGDGVEGEQGEVDVSTARAKGKPSGELVISNWALYIDRQTIPQFEQQTGISVKYIEDINSYEEFFGKMRPLAPAFENLNPALKPPATDPERDFSIPWQGGMTGLIVNTKEAPDITSVNDLFDPKYKGRVEMVSELREVVPLVMKADGIDPEEATEDDWMAAIDKLKQAAESGQIRRITGGDYAGDLANGEAVAVVGWAADAVQLQADNPDLRFVMPDEGCILWYDNWVIPVGAPNPTAAYEFINYTYEPQNQAQIVGYTGSVTPGAGVKEIFERQDPKLAENPLIFSDEEYTANCSSILSPPGGPEAEGRVEEAWLDAVTG